MTQTEEWREQARQPEPPADYFVVESSSLAWYVTCAHRREGMVMSL